MPAEELGGRVDHDVGAVLDRAQQVRGSQRGVHDQRQAGGVRDLGQALEVGDVAGRVGDDLGVDGLGVLADRRGEVGRVGGVDERGLDAEAAQGHVELGDGSAVELGGRDNVVARAGQRREGDELGCHAGAGGDGADAALERGDAFLEGRNGRVADARVDVAVLLQGEEVRGIVGVLEDKRRGLVDRHGTGTVLGIRGAAGMQCARAESKLMFGHEGG